MVDIITDGCEHKHSETLVKIYFNIYFKNISEIN